MFLLFHFILFYFPFDFFLYLYYTIFFPDVQNKKNYPFVSNFSSDREVLISSELKPQVLSHWSDFLNITEDITVSLKLTESSKMQLTESNKIKLADSNKMKLSESFKYCDPTIGHLNKTTEHESSYVDINHLIVEKSHPSSELSDVAYRSKACKSKKCNAIRFVGKPIETVFLCLKENSKKSLIMVSDIKGAPCSENIFIFSYFCSLIDVLLSFFFFLLFISFLLFFLLSL